MRRAYGLRASRGLEDAGSPQTWRGEGEIRIAIARKAIVPGLQNKGAPLIPVTIDPGSRPNFQQLLADPKPLSDPALPDGHTNYYRSDDVAAVAYFYLDRPGGVLPAVAASAERRAALRVLKRNRPENEVLRPA